MNPVENVLLGIPSGGGVGIMGPTALAAANTVNSKRHVFLSTKCSSLLPFVFNALLCEALNHRGEPNNINRFVMLHSDIVPAVPDWIDRLLDLMNSEGADVISVMPIKDPQGLTSTALDTDPWRPRRLTMTEIMAAPDVFDNDYAKSIWGHDVLFNTGLMAVRLDQEWSTRIVFDLRSRVVMDKQGIFQPEIEPEDWRFSRWCHQSGLRCAVTRQIPASHIGLAGFNNTAAWGALETDTVNTPENLAASRGGRP